MANESRLSAPLSAYARDRHGSVTIMAAVSLPVLIGVVALVAEFGHGLLTRVENQRVADLAAFAGASTYNATGSRDAMNAAIANVAALNGMPSGAVTGSLVASLGGEADRGVSVTATTTNILLLAPVLGGGANLPVSASALAEFNPPTSAACILALNQSGTGVTLGNSARVSGTNCTVASNARIAATGCAQGIVAKAVVYRTTIGRCSSSDNILQANGASAPASQKTTADPLAGHPGIAAAAARFPLVGQTFAALATPPASSKNVTFGTGSTLASIQAQLPSGCTVASAGSTAWRVDCLAGGTYSFGSVTVQNDHSAVFTANAGLTFNVRNSISNGGKALTFGPGTFNVGGNIATSGVATSTFGSGTFNVGGSITTATTGQATFGAGTFNVGGSISTASTTQATFGQGSFRVAAGIQAGSASRLSLGTGTGNSFQVGPAADGSALTVSNSATVTLADATDSGKLFAFSGKIVTSDASCLLVGAAPQHDIKGALEIGGGVLLGTGTYTVDGYLSTANAPSPCGGSTIGIKGANVTLVLSGSATCLGNAFCVPNSFPVVLGAPTSGSLAKLAVVGPTSPSRTGGAALGNSAAVTASGAFYFPNGPVTVGGSSVLTDPSTGECLQLVGSQISVSNSALLSSRCTGSGSSGPAVMLVR